MTRLTLMGAVMQEASGFSIIFLGAGGLASCGDTLEEVLLMGKEALELYVAAAVDHGDRLPEPTAHTIGDVDAWLYEGEDDGGDRGAWVGLFPIEVEVPEAGTNVPVYVNANLMQRIAELSENTNSRIDSRRFIEDAVEHEIERYRKSAA